MYPFSLRHPYLFLLHYPILYYHLLHSHKSQGLSNCGLYKMCDVGCHTTISFLIEFF